MTKKIGQAAAVDGCLVQTWMKEKIHFPSVPIMVWKSVTHRFCLDANSSDCLLSDAESSSSDSPVADKRAPGSERAAERAAQQCERERIRLAPQTTFANMQVCENP